MTSFALLSLSRLQEDPQDRTNALLQIIVSQLGSPSALPDVSVPPQITPSRATVRLNVLWFSSLTCSLVAALGAVLAKQWIVEYPRGLAPSTTACERAQHRQIRFSGLHDWHFSAIVDSFSSLIQIALLLFFVGLCDFLLSQDRFVGSVVTALCASGLLLVLFCYIAAVIFPSCPFQTPLSTSLIPVYRFLADTARNAVFGPASSRNNLWFKPTGWRSCFVRGWKRIRYGDPQYDRVTPRWAAIGTKDEQLATVNAQALAWLLRCAQEENVRKASSIIPTLRSSDLRIPLANALPRLCILFQSYFDIGGDLDALYRKIVPRWGQEANIRTIGRAIHRIMMVDPSTQGDHTTRFIRGIFGDACLVFPPRDLPPDIHALVCSLFAADPSCYGGDENTVQPNLFLSLVASQTISPWAQVMVLDSLCVYLSVKPRWIPYLKAQLISHLGNILHRMQPMPELSSAVGLTINFILSGNLNPGAILADKAKLLLENLYPAICAVMEEYQIHSQKQEDIDTCLVALLKTFHNFASTFLPTQPERRQVLALLCEFLLRGSWSPATVAAVISIIIDCYPNDNLPLTVENVRQILPQILHLIHTGLEDNEFKSILHLINRLVDIGIGPPGSLLLSSKEEFGVVLVNLLERTGSNETKAAVLYSLARHAGFWFYEGELCSGLQAAGINTTILGLLSGLIPESELELVLAIAYHLALASPLSFVQADPNLQAFESILQRRELEPRIRQRCATIMLCLIQHLQGEDGGRVLDSSQVIAFAIATLTADDQVEQYIVEEWLEMSQSIAKTHRAKLNESGFLDALRSAATTHGIIMPDWISNDRTS